MSEPSVIDMDTTLERLERELENIRKDPPEGCLAHPKDSNIFEWRASIQGPRSSPYEGGSFRLAVQFPTDYPFTPPTVVFITKIYHPNIDIKNGLVGLSVLHRDWSPALTLSTVLLSIRAFLGEPDATDGVIPEIAHEYEVQRSEYEGKARLWTEKFAKEHSDNLT